MNWNFDHLMATTLRRWEKQPQTARLWAGLWLTCLTGVAFWLSLGSTGLLDETEPLFAEAARQMTVTGDWITPYFNGDTRFDKPPLVYWIMAAAYRVIGVNEWAVRFPSALSATLLTVFGFYTLQYFGGSRPVEVKPCNPSADADAHPDGSPPPRPALQLAAWIGAAAMALNLQTIAWGRIGVSDMLLSGCMGGGLLAFFWGYATPHPPQKDRWYLAFYGLCALAVLAKGPIGMLLPGLIVLAFLLYLGKLRQVLGEMRWIRGSLVFLAITLPWYIAIIGVNGEDYIESFFGYHNVERFTRVVNSHWAPLWFYLVVVPAAFIPWSAYLPVAILRLRFWQPQRWRHQPRSTHLGLFAVIWFGVIFSFFTIAATKLPSYTIPLLPAAAILVALFWSDQWSDRWSDQWRNQWSDQQNNSSTNHTPRRALSISHWVNFGLAVVLSAASFYSPNWMGNEPEMPQLAEQMRQSGLMVWGGWIWAIMAGVELGLLLRRQGRWIWSVQLVGFLAFLLVTLLPALKMLDVQRQLPLRQLAATVVQVQQPEEPILMIGQRKPSLVFYTQRPITYVAALSDVPKRLERLSRRLSRPRSKVHSLLILGRPTKLQDAGIQPEDYETIADAGVHRLGRMHFPPANAPQSLLK